MDENNQSDEQNQASPASPETATSSPEPAPPAENSEVQTEPMTEEAAAAPAQPDVKPKSKMHIMLIILIAVVLLGAAIYFYYSTNKTDTASTNETPQSAAQSEAPVPATTADLDAAAKEVDHAISDADQISDAASDDLSDSALGL